MNSYISKGKLLAAALVLSMTTQAQVIKTGKSDNSVVVKNINAGFDVGESEATISLTNYSKPVLVKPQGVIWGVNAKTKNEDGLAEWFNTGTFQPSSSMNGVFGYYFTSVTDGVYPDIQDDKSVLAEYEVLTKEINDQLSRLIDAPTYALTDAQKKQEKDFLQARLANKISTFHKLQDALKKKVDSPENVPSIDRLHRDMYDHLTKGEMSAKIDAFYSHQEFMDERENRITNILSKRKFWTAKVYGTFGANSENLTLFSDWNTANMEKSFKKEYFRGGNVGGGINYSWRGKWTIGAMDRYEEGNNTELLTAKSYTVTTTVTENNQTASSTKQAKAYKSSEYAKVYFNSFYVDVMRYFPLRKDSCIIVADVYFRNKQSNNQTQFASHSDIGISGAIFKKSGKFVGGLYFELPDIDEKLAKMDPEYEPKSWYNRLTFGVYVKFSFTTLLSAL